MAKMKQLLVELEENQKEIDLTMESIKVLFPYLYNMLFMTDDEVSSEMKIFSLRQEAKVEPELSILIVDGIHLGHIRSDIIDYINNNKTEINDVLINLERVLDDQYDILFRNDVTRSDKIQVLTKFCEDHETASIIATGIQIGYITNGTTASSPVDELLKVI